MGQSMMLTIQDLQKSYAGVRALKGVSLEFQPGEIHSLVGENGAGKSTLIKCLAGVVRPDSGRFLFDGAEQQIHSHKDAAKNGLSFIHQELNLVSYFNAMENIFLGHTYPRTKFHLIDWRGLKERATAILQQLQVTLPLDIPVSRLASGQRSLVAIARAFAVQGQFYFMDEPATALTDNEKESLFRVIRNLRDQGRTVVLVSHNLDDVMLLSDRISVLRDGQAVGTFRKDELTKDLLISHMIGRNLSNAFPPRAVSAPGAEILAVENLGDGYLQGINFSVRSGEILGIGGLAGSGRTELLELVFGVRKPSAGTMSLAGNRYAPGLPKQAVAAGVALVPEERRKQGLVMNRSITDNMSLMSLERWAAGGLLRKRVLSTAAQSVGVEVRLKAGSLTDQVMTLSGGNQQKVVFAKTILKTPRLLLLDEPSQGVDVGARFEIYSLIQDLAAKGAAVLLVSSDFNEILGLADRLLFLREGRQVAVVDNKGIDQHAYLNYCYGRTGGLYENQL